ncbi:glycosyltransferase [Aeromonas sp. 11P]|uniref:glycosyltransferase n=1 Tax=Aeromonas sp. 11P TaxID=3452713 RepID=UPI003F7AFDF4
MKSDTFVSVITVLGNVSESTLQTIYGIQQELDKCYTDYEVLVIAQGPILDSVDNKWLDNVLQHLPSIRYIQLSANVDNDVAWAAGLENAIGDFVLLFDHVQDPIDVISQMVDKCKSGYDVIVGVTDTSKTSTYKIFRKFAGRLLNAIDYHLPPNSTGLRCLSRRAVNSVTMTGKYHHQLYLRIQKTGYPSYAFKYEITANNNEKKTFLNGLRQLVHLLVFNSSRPLRWMSSLGLIGSSTAFIFATYSLLAHLINGHVVEGWTTTILFMSMLFMFQFIMLAFFGEYIGRLLDEKEGHADYSVVFEKNSSVMVNEDRFNVLDISTQQHNNRVQTGRDR